MLSSATFRHAQLKIVIGFTSDILELSDPVNKTDFEQDNNCIKEIQPLSMQMTV